MSKNQENSQAARSLLVPFIDRAASGSKFRMGPRYVKVINSRYVMLYNFTCPNPYVRRDVVYRKTGKHFREKKKHVLSVSGKKDEAVL